MLACIPTEELLKLDILQPEKIKDTYQLNISWYHCDTACN